MPISIRELVVRATVDESEQAGGSSGDSGVSEREAIIRECVEQVMERLKEEEER